MHGPWDPMGSRLHGARWARGRGAGGDVWAEMWNEWWRGPAPRAERGTVRWLVLDAIATQARHGYEIIQSIGDKSGGKYKPSPGVIYPTLQMLEELGHARTIPRGERKVYELTDDGRQELQAHQDEVAEFYEGQADFGWQTQAEEVRDVMKRVQRVAHLFKRSVHRGGIRPTTMRKARKVLDEALQKLEEIMSQEDL